MADQYKRVSLPFASRVVIPPVLYADATGEPFKHCVMCSKALDEPDTHYMIEKALRYDRKNDVTETLLEYAICSDCYEKMAASLSKESVDKLTEYFRHNIDLYSRIHLLTDGKTDVKEWLAKCALTGQDLKDCDEYQICCECEGGNVVLSHLPVMFSGAAIEAMAELLSPETKEELDRFRDEFLGIPPEWRELLKERPPVFV